MRFDTEKRDSALRTYKADIAQALAVYKQHRENAFAGYAGNLSDMGMRDEFRQAWVNCEDALQVAACRFTTAQAEAILPEAPLQKLAA